MQMEKGASGPGRQGEEAEVDTVIATAMQDRRQSGLMIARHMPSGTVESREGNRPAEVGGSGLTQRKVETTGDTAKDRV